MGEWFGHFVLAGYQTGEDRVPGLGWDVKGSLGSDRAQELPVIEQEGRWYEGLLSGGMWVVPVMG